VGYGPFAKRADMGTSHTAECKDNTQPNQLGYLALCNTQLRLE
jgi:hypothetical protein